jgi:archaeosine-15-forming tRNA-guanine transglycosylase
MRDVENVVEDDGRIRLVYGEGKTLATMHAPGSDEAELLYLASILHHALISGAGAKIRALALRDVERFAPELVDA